MSDYSQGKIYRLVSTLTDKIYIGSTTDTLRIRLSNHRCHFRRWGNGDTHEYTTAFELIKLDDCQIELIEDHPCRGERELKAREQYWIDKNKSLVVNKNRAFVSIETRKSEALERSKKWAADHKEERAEYLKKYHEDHLEEHKERCKSYYQKNKESQLAKQAERIVCLCGKTIARGKISRHERSKYHLSHLPKKFKNSQVIFDDVSPGEDGSKQAPERAAPYSAPASASNSGSAYPAPASPRPGDHMTAADSAEAGSASAPAHTPRGYPREASISASSGDASRASSAAPHS